MRPELPETSPGLRKALIIFAIVEALAFVPFVVGRLFD
jgi:hypothetical protein